MHCQEILVRQLTSTALLDSTFNRYKQKRKQQRNHYDLWWMAWNWEQVRAEIQTSISNGSYQFAPTRRITREDKVFDVFCVKDTVVLSALAAVLKQQLSPLLHSCTHLAGPTAGVRATNKAIKEHIQDYPYAIRSDVLKYYASVNHDRCMHLVERYIPNNPTIHNFIHQYLTYVKGDYTINTQGITRGTALSPVIGALYLLPFDDAITKHKDVFYQRYMDDWVILCKDSKTQTKALQTMYQCLWQAKMQTHPDKTTIGETKDGFDFLGLQFNEQEQPEQYKQALALLRKTPVTKNTFTHLLSKYISREQVAKLLLRQTATNGNIAPLQLSFRTYQRLIEKIQKKIRQSASFKAIRQYINRWQGYWNHILSYVQQE